jgi:non-ribosomal peptide synthetase component E (peptide arylation enzyme)
VLSRAAELWLQAPLERLRALPRLRVQQQGPVQLSRQQAQRQRAQLEARVSAQQLERER